MGLRGAALLGVQMLQFYHLCVCPMARTDAAVLWERVTQPNHRNQSCRKEKKKKKIDWLLVNGCFDPLDSGPFGPSQDGLKLEDDRGRILQATGHL